LEREERRKDNLLQRGCEVQINLKGETRSAEPGKRGPAPEKRCWGVVEKKELVTTLSGGKKLQRKTSAGKGKIGVSHGKEEELPILSGGKRKEKKLPTPRGRKKKG